MVCAPVQRDNPRAKARGLSLCAGAQTMLYLACTTMTSVDLSHTEYSMLKIGYLRIVVQVHGSFFTGILQLQTLKNVQLLIKKADPGQIAL